MDKQQFREALKASKRIVIKIGSGVVSQNNSINKYMLSSIAEDIAQLISYDKEIALVSSGAVACGMNLMSLKKRPDNIVNLQALASIGQPELMNIYKKLFSKHSIEVSQVLITVDDIQNRRRFINAKNTLLTLIRWRLIPIVNENDTVVIQELRFGDNDSLSFHVLNLIDADALIILSDIDGVYSKDPNCKDATFIEKIENNTHIENGKANKLGSGGIKSKVEACLNTAELGKLACIANGTRKNALRKIFEDENFRFSFFEPYKEPIKSKKSWILNCSPSGVVVIDGGAKKSLKQNKSLLPSGIDKVYGGFDRGDVINIEDQEGNLVAKGITNYDSSEIEKIKKHHSDEIVKILGYKYSNDVIHINNMVVAEEK